MRKLEKFEELFLKNAIEFFKEQVILEIKEVNNNGNPIITEKLIVDTCQSLKEKLLNKNVKINK